MGMTEPELFIAFFPDGGYFCKKCSRMGATQQKRSQMRGTHKKCSQMGDTFLNVFPDGGYSPKIDKMPWGILRPKSFPDGGYFHKNIQMGDTPPKKRPRWGVLS